MGEIIVKEMSKVEKELGSVKTNAIVLIGAGIGAVIIGVLLYLEDARNQQIILWRAFGFSFDF